MVTHIVIFTWVAGTEASQVDALTGALDALAIELEDLGTIQHGPDLRFRGGNGDYGLVATFADRSGWTAYQAHPAHQALVRDFVTPIQASRVAIQI